VLISSQSGKRQMSIDGTKANFFEAEKIDEKIVAGKTTYLLSASFRYFSACFSYIWQAILT
jgi:hypothetical protein